MATRVSQREGKGWAAQVRHLKSSGSGQLYLLLEAKQHHQREAEERQGVRKASGGLGNFAPVETFKQPFRQVYSHSATLPALREEASSDKLCTEWLEQELANQWLAKLPPQPQHACDVGLQPPDPAEVWSPCVPEPRSRRWPRLRVLARSFGNFARPLPARARPGSLTKRH